MCHKTYDLWVCTAADPAGDELQRLLLDGSHALDQRLFRDVLATARHRTRHVLTHHFVHVQHVEVDSTQLYTHTYSVNADGFTPLITPT